jgi:hypothetical protein
MYRFNLSPWQDGHQSLRETGDQGSRRMSVIAI